MYSELLLCIAVLAAMIYLPAYLALRGLNFERTLSLAFAPLVSLPFFSIEAIGLAKMEIPCSWTILVTPLVLLGAIGLVALIIRNLKDTQVAREKSLGLQPNILQMFAFLGAGLIAMGLFYLYPLGDAGAFICGNDIAHHLNLTRSFIDSGNWSTLETTTTPGETGSFYPSLWSLMAALCMGCLDVPVTVASNATNACIIGVIFPLSMYAFALRVLRGNDIAIYLCAILSMSFFGFPWEMFVRKTLLYPNAIGFALMPGFLTACMCCFQDQIRFVHTHNDKVHVTSSTLARKAEVNRKNRHLAIGLSIMGLAAIAFAHPNTVFTSIVFLSCYGFHIIAHSITNAGLQDAKRIFTTIVVCAVYIAACVAIWIMMASLPFLQSVVTNAYDASSDLPHAVLKLIILKSPHIGAQYPLALLVACGLVFSLLDKNRRWITLPFVLAVALYLANAVLSDGTFKHLVSGFWYNHPTRLFASMTIFAIPVASMGAEGIVHLLERARKSKGQTDKGHGRHVHNLETHNLHPIAYIGLAAILVTAIFVLPLPLPRATNFHGFVNDMQSYNDPSSETSFLTQDERYFLAEVAETIDAKGNGRILNLPHDGSVFAYALYDEDTMIRDLYGSPDEAVLELTQHIDDVGSDPAIVHTAEELGVAYVVRLDDSESDNSTIYQNRYDKATWSGILGITDDTPGFETVLKKDDMRLYRIIKD